MYATIQRVRTCAACVAVLLCAMIAPVSRQPAAYAHGGDDHGPAATNATPVGAGQLSTYAVTAQFEVLLKYAPPHVKERARLRFFMADYATNRPVEGATFVLSSKPAGVVAASPPVMSSPGVYDVDVTFPEDTVYALNVTLAAGDRSETVALPNVYAGDAAEHFVAEHGGEAVQHTDDGPGWPVWAGIAAGALVLVAVVIYLARRRRAGHEKLKNPDLHERSRPLQERVESDQENVS